MKKGEHMAESPAAPRGGPGIQARGLAKRYGSKAVIDDLSFTAEAGAAVERGGSANLLVADADSALVGKIAAAEGIALDELARVRESLEDVFLRLTHDVTEYESRAA
jgi:hypothetical protein